VFDNEASKVILFVGFVGLCGQYWGLTGVFSAFIIFAAIVPRDGKNE